jgi:DNA-directed RNA polymerase subunit RPC12/RpoP
MAHSALICQRCFTEVELGTASDAGTATSQDGVVCPNCGNESFGI